MAKAFNCICRNYFVRWLAILIARNLAWGVEDTFMVICRDGRLGDGKWNGMNYFKTTRRLCYVMVPEYHVRR